MGDWVSCEFTGRNRSYLFARFLTILTDFSVKGSDVGSCDGEVKGG